MLAPAMRASIVLALLALGACAPEESSSSAPAGVAPAVRGATRERAASSELPALGSAPHESVLASSFVGSFQAPSGEVVELRGDGTYGARFDGEMDGGAWYAFGGRPELRADEQGASALGFDLVGLGDDLVLVPDGLLARFVLESREGRLSRRWLRRAAAPGDARPDLPPPFDTIARLAAPALDLAGWRGSFRAATLEMFESLDLDEHARFAYESHGCWSEPERALGSVGVFGNLLRLDCDAGQSAVHFADQALFAPLRRGARRYLVPCDDVWRVANAKRWAPAVLDTLYMHDGVELGTDVWSGPAVFASWFDDATLSARVLRVGLAGPASRRTSVVTLDAGRAQGVYRGQWLSAVEDRANELRVVLVREDECDAVPLDPVNDVLPQAVGWAFDSDVR